MGQVSNLIARKLNTMVEAPNMHTTLRSKYKTIGTLFPYATRLEQYGQQEMVDTILLAARAQVPIFQWHRIRTHITTVFDESSPPSLNQVIALMSPYFPWHRNEFPTKNAVTRWAAAAATVPYSEEVGRSVVDALLQISGYTSLQALIPADVWALLKKWPSLPPVCLGRSIGAQQPTVRHVRQLEDLEILLSYFLLVWSEWGFPTSGIDEMLISIREDFGGIGMWGYRGDLIRHLEHVQGQLDLGLEHFKYYKPETDEDRVQRRKERYGHLRDELLEVDKRAMEILTRTFPRLIIFE